MRRRARGSDCPGSRSRAAEHSALRETPMTDPSDKMCKHWPYPANVFLLSFAYTSIHRIAQYYVLYVVYFCGYRTPSRRPRLQANRTLEPVTDRAPGTRKLPARDSAGHTLCGRHDASECRRQTPADPKTRRAVWVSDPVPDCADRRSGCGRSAPRSRGCRGSRDGRLHRRRRGRHRRPCRLAVRRGRWIVRVS